MAAPESKIAENFLPSIRILAKRAVAGLLIAR